MAEKVGSSSPVYNYNFVINSNVGQLGGTDNQISGGQVGTPAEPADLRAYHELISMI